MMVGKNYSLNDLGQRKDSDFYETPYCLTRLLLDKEELKGSILEPACGKGAIVRVLEERGYEVASYDKSIGKDFLDEDTSYDTIITNPPFSLAKEFILKCKEISKVFYLLLPLSYLHGKERYDLIYTDNTFKLEKIYVFTRYPLLGEDIREDGKHRTGMMVYAWYKFNKDYEGLPVIDWLDNNSFVLKKRNRSVST